MAILHYTVIYWIVLQNPVNTKIGLPFMVILSISNIWVTLSISNILVSWPGHIPHNKYLWSHHPSQILKWHVKVDSECFPIPQGVVNVTVPAEFMVVVGLSN